MLRPGSSALHSNNQASRGVMGPFREVPISNRLSVDKARGAGGTRLQAMPREAF